MSDTQIGPAQPVAPQPPLQGQRTSTSLVILGLVLGLLGLGIGTAAWFRAGPKLEGPAAYSEQQAAEAKKAVCDAYNKGVRSFQIAGNRGVTDPAEKLPIAVNTRLAEVAAGNYLKNAVQAHPAAPIELQELVNTLADLYQKIALTQLAEGTQSEVDPLGRAADQVIPRINQKCQ